MSTRQPVPAIVILSGERRGTTLRLSADRLELGTADTADISIPANELSVAGFRAFLVRRGESYELTTTPQAPVWVNGAAVDQMTLASGDVLELGPGGPTLRFRLYPPGSGAFKSVAEAFADCLECARNSSPHVPGRAAAFVGGAPRELLTQTAPWFRGVVLIALAALIAAVGVQMWRTRQLEQRLTLEAERVGGIARLLERSEREFLRREDFEQTRQEVSGQLTEAAQRLDDLETRSTATARVLANASRSVVFLQGAYGFIDPESRRPLRFSVGPDGRPLLTAAGEPGVGLDGSGPLVELLYTGTAFVVGENGELMTNRHVALPWNFDDSAGQLLAQGLAPDMRRFVGYLPGVPEPFDVTLVAASDDADVALLRCSGVTAEIPALEFADRQVVPGDEILVLGYPTGMRALLARAEPAFVDTLFSERGTDFWSIGERLAGGGHIEPLASRGIVGQVTPTAVVYDAETTQGGSGGPVLDLDGHVVAINAAILPEFGGSNLGVPAARGRALIEGLTDEEGRNRATQPEAGDRAAGDPEDGPLLH